MEDVLEITTLPRLYTRESRRSGRIVRAIHRFMFLGEAVFDEHDLHPSNYNEANYDKNSNNWQSVMKVEMEFMYSTLIWELVETLVIIKSIGCK